MKYISSIITVTQGDWQYLKEWIEYHHNIGINLFLIAYNGPKEKMKDLPKYDYVKYYDYSTSDNPLFSQFTEKGKEFSGWIFEDKEYDMRIMQQIENQLLRELIYFFPMVKYCCVIDVDEFIDIHSGPKNITFHLDRNFNKKEYPAIKIQMRFYTDNNQIYNNFWANVRERFTEKYKDVNAYKDPGMGKSILNLWHNDVRYGKTKLNSPHTCFNMPNYVIPPKEIELNHYWTKSLEEWISKFNPENDKHYLHRFPNIMFKNFFSMNKITEEKLKAIPELLKKYNIDYDPLKEADENFVNQYKKANSII